MQQWLIFVSISIGSLYPWKGHAWPPAVRIDLPTPRPSRKFKFKQSRSAGQNFFWSSIFNNAARQNSTPLLYIVALCRCYEFLAYNASIYILLYHCNSTYCTRWIRTYLHRHRVKCGTRLYCLTELTLSFKPTDSGMRYETLLVSKPSKSRLITSW